MCRRARSDTVRERDVSQCEKTETSLPGRRIGVVSTHPTRIVPLAALPHTVPVPCTSFLPMLSSHVVPLFAFSPQRPSLCFLPASSPSALSHRIDPVPAITAHRPFLYFPPPLLPKATLSLLLHPTQSLCLLLPHIDPLSASPSPALRHQHRPSPCFHPHRSSPCLSLHHPHRSSPCFLTRTIPLSALFTLHCPSLCSPNPPSPTHTVHLSAFPRHSFSLCLPAHRPSLCFLFAFPSHRPSLCFPAPSLSAFLPNTVPRCAFAPHRPSPCFSPPSLSLLSHTPSLSLLSPRTVPLLAPPNPPHLTPPPSPTPPLHSHALPSPLVSPQTHHHASAGFPELSSCFSRAVP